jgi:signal transduction histidine kinase
MSSADGGRQAAHDHLQIALDALDAAVFEISDSGRLSADGRFERLFGRSPSDVPNRTAFLERVVHPADRETVDRRFGQAVETPGSAVAVDFRTHPECGGVRRVHADLSVRGDDDDRRLVGVATEPADDRRLEQQLVSLHEAGRDLITAESPAEVARLTMAASETILGFANTTVRLTDADNDLLRKVAATEGAEGRAGDLADYPLDGETPAARAYRRREPRTVEALGALADDYDRGDLRAAMYVPLGDHGVMSIGHTESGGFDDTDRELANTLGKLASAALTRLDSEAELRATNERLERLVSFVSHDLRNPLNVAAGRLELAAAECPSEHLSSVETALERIDVLIDDLLVLAREGGGTPDLEPISLRTVADQSWAHVATGDATVRIDTDRVVRADDGRLGQLFENLFRNSVEHGSTGDRSPAATADGTVVTVGSLEDGFYVEDDGPGVPRERREDVFDVGYSSAGDGTGLGLAIVREIATTHGWDVTLTDGADGGARFEFTGVDPVDSA